VAVVQLRDKDLPVLRDIFARFPEVREARVFGSRALGHARRASDIDLAVTAPEMSPRAWSDLCGAIEEAPIIYHIDVVRTEKLPDGPFKDKIGREGVTIYP